MTLKISGYTFVGPFASTEDDQLKSAEGVYVILTDATDGWKLLDTGDADDLKSTLQNHKRRACWKKHAVGKVAFAVKYCEIQGRNMITREIRKEHSVPCGSL